VVAAQIHRLLAEENVRIVVTAYHNPFNRGSRVLDLLDEPRLIRNIRNPLFHPSCAGWSLRDLYRRVDTVVRRLNAALQNVVTLAPQPAAVALASLYLAFESHKAAPPVCSDQPVPLGTWIQTANLQPPFLDCVHPNGLGAAVYAATVEQAARPLLP
jgi:hypothetical protein